MPISDKHKVIFVHIPKTGGKSISSLLGISSSNSKNLYLDGLTHLTADMIEQRIDTDEYYWMAFVRDPYTKILSEYRWRMSNRHSAVFNEPTKEHIPFDRYMETLLSRWNNMESVEWRQRAHVMPQWMFLNDKVNVFRYEQFDDECDKIKRMFDIGIKTPYINKGYGLPKHTPQTIEIVNELYAEDFRRFGYNLY